ncbi:hypothetical protein [Novacetimonas sp. GS1]|uniref:hypothetical protein n=1 Tax=Novacetimonas sp. GS1 TaxID=3119990 RepID=UPI002FCCDD06
MRGMVLSALGFFFAGGIDTAYAVSVSRLPVMTAPPGQAVQNVPLHMRPCVGTDGVRPAVVSAGLCMRHGAV